MLTLIGIILFYLGLFLQRKFKKIQQQKPNVSACDQLSEGPPSSGAVCSVQRWKHSAGRLELACNSPAC